jgi:hypothetical protein
MKAAVFSSPMLEGAPASAKAGFANYIIACRLCLPTSYCPESDAAAACGNLNSASPFDTTPTDEARMPRLFSKPSCNLASVEFGNLNSVYPLVS